VVPLTVVALYGASVTRSERIATAQARNLQQARNTARTLDEYLERVSADVRVVALAPGTVRLLAGEADPGLAEDVRLSLVQMRETHGFEALYLTNGEGTVRVASEERFLGRAYVSSQWFLNAIAGDASFDEPRWDPEDREVSIHVSTPVRTPDGQIVGVAIGQLRLGDIDRIIAGDTNFAGRGEFGILWDSEGVRLSHPSKPGLRFRAFERLAPDSLARLTAEARFGPRTAALVHGAPPYPGIVERSRWLLYDPQAPPSFRLDSGGSASYASIAPLEKKRWLYGVFTPERILLAEVDRQTRRNLALAGLTALLAAAIAFQAARWVTQPLRGVERAAAALAGGDMSQRVHLQQRDEVGRLGAAFDTMADALAAKEAELRDHADRLEQRVQEQTAALRASEEELRRLYQLEQEARRKAEEANRVKDEFLSTVSHELRTPLNAILGWTWLLGGGKLDAEAAARAVATIERNARAQSQIIDDLLDVSRIITGKLRLQMAEIDLTHVIEAALDSVRPAADAKEIRVECRLDPATAAVSGDPHRLQQVVWNLLSNAVKFTPRGGGVEVRLARAGGQVELRVADTGIGIQPDFLNYVFDRFRQADSSTTRAHGGLGLGLAIVRHLVELHGGTVHAESEGENLGAAFTVRLPVPASRQPAADAEPEIPQALAAPAPAALHPLAGLRVLLVDDEADASEMLRTVLEQFGVAVTVTSSAAQALAALRRTEFDALVADIGMPDEDGYSLIAKVRTLDGGARSLPAIALTAYAGDVDRRRALDAGFQIHLAKPVEPHTLAAFLAAVARGAVHSG
jgi:signal transduction histidine kinase/ActR/RegA family two-component response regulator